MKAFKTTKEPRPTTPKTGRKPRKKTDDLTKREYVDDRDLERLTPIGRSTWQLMRYQRLGPPYIKLQKRVVYRWLDVIAWFDSQRVEGDPKAEGDNQ